MENEKQELCKNLVYFRKKNNYTQVELAKKIGYSNKNISKWENGEITPDIFLLHKLCEIYNITLDELLSGENEEKINLLNEEKEKNKKMRHHIIFLSILLFSFLILGTCAVISTIIDSSDNVNKYRWLVYLYGAAICTIPLYVYFKIFARKHIISVLLLVLFIITLFLGIFYSTDCSPWLFLVAVPIFFIIYFYSNLMDVITSYAKTRHLSRKNHKIDK